MSHGPVTLQRHTAEPWRLCSQSVVLTSANTNMFLFRTHHSLVHSLRIQFRGSHVCSRSLTLCVRVQVHFWSREDVPWTSHSSETHSWTLETLLCPPLPPHNHSSSDWEEKHCELKHTKWSQVRKLLHCFPVVTVTWDSCRFNVLDSANHSVESNCWLTDLFILNLILSKVHE